jgi:hypothetical protein
MTVVLPLKNLLLFIELFMFGTTTDLSAFFAVRLPNVLHITYHTNALASRYAYETLVAVQFYCPPFACLQCKGWAIAMTLSVRLSVCPHKTRNCEETERRTKKVLEIKVVGYRDSYSGVPSFVTSDDL